MTRAKLDGDIGRAADGLTAGEAGAAARLASAAARADRSPGGPDEAAPTRRRGRPVRDLDEVFTAARKPATITNVLAQSSRLKAVLREMLLFRAVSDADFERFYTLLRWRRVPGGAQLLASGERSPWVFLLAEGTAKVHQESLSGAGVIYSICGAGEVLGELSAIDGEAHSATVTMLEASLLAAIDRDEFVSFLLDVPQMALNVAANTSRRLRAATARIQALSRLDVTGRLASQLLLFASCYGQAPLDRPGARGVSIDLHLRQSDLADLIGASRVRVNQALHGLRRLGHINVHGNRITLLDMDALRARCEWR